MRALTRFNFSDKQFSISSYPYAYHKYIILISIIQLLCASSLVVASDLLGHTRRWRQIHVRSTSLDLFLSFPMPQNHAKFLINHLNFYCIKQIDNIFPCVCTVIDHRRRQSQRIKNNSHATPTSSRVVRFILYTLWCHLWSITVHTHGKI